MPMTESAAPTAADLRHLVRVAAAVAAAPPTVVRQTLREDGLAATASLVEEVLLQAHLFAGFPRALNAMAVWREISGMTAPADDTDPDPAEVRSRGEAACRRVYGPVYEPLRANVQALHPALDRWMLADGYGKVLSRPALPLLARELCIVASCAAAEQAPQLRSHLHGALNCGASREDLSATLDALAGIVAPDALAAARAALARVIASEER